MYYSIAVFDLHLMPNHQEYFVPDMTARLSVPEDLRMAGGGLLLKSVCVGGDRPATD